MVTFLRPEDPPEEDLPTCFIDKYAAWASTVTDAPIQYHRAIGASILSTVMTPHITLPTSFGVFIPNIWIMILAGTTLTRKSTSLDLGKRLLDDVMDDYLLATDGSPEGLFTGLADRDTQVSVFHRDEITGFMSAVMHKDYMSGVLEGFTRLYDGQPETRMLRREKIEIKKPYFVIMSGGIKSRMEEIVGMEHIRSGFLPRFIFVTGEQTPENRRPIGPPNDDEIFALMGEESPRERLVDLLWNIYRYYNEPEPVNDDKSNVFSIAGITKVAATPKPKHVKLQGSPEFWNRLRELEDSARELGDTSSDPNLYGPLYDRLKNSILKVAILICGADLRDKITETDLQKAIHLGEEWLATVTGFALAIEQHPHLNPWEKRCDSIASFVKAQHPRPVTQTEVMQKFRVRKRDICDLEETLMARGSVYIDPFPNPKNRKGSQIHYHVPGVQDIARNRNKEDSYVVEDETHRRPTTGLRPLPRRPRNTEEDGA